MAAVAERSGGLIGFLMDALRPVFTGRLAGPMAIFLVLLTASNIVILFNVPVKGQLPPLGFVAAAFVRIAGLLVLSVAILRRLNDSPRPAWLPDAGFWLFALTSIGIIVLAIALEIVVNLVAGAAAGARPDLVIGVLVNAFVAVAMAPLAAWFTAMAVERPLAWRPGRWLRAAPDWLPHYIVWTILVMTPLGAVHAAIDRRLIVGAGESFWSLALADGLLSLVLAVVGLGISSEAYRRVARS